MDPMSSFFRSWVVAPMGLALVVFAAVHPGAARARAEQPPATGDESEFAALMNEGQALYGTSCVSCHADPGMESIGPTFGGNAALTSKEHVIRKVLEGVADKGMPPFAPTLNDRQVAAVTTFIRNAWENAYGVVREGEVAGIRQALTKK